MSQAQEGAAARLVAGRYQLVRLLGRGGMGVVWLAEDQLVSRQVAVKELRPPAGLPAGERETFRQRALAEARSAARIHHPGAVTLFDVLPPARDADPIYLIMELVEGQTLSEIISLQRRLPDATVAGLGMQLASVLAAAHALGVVHRDVKPGNIMITASGQVKLTDFGIAHTLGDPRLTRSGVMGTQAYMAPELFDAAPITPAADVWSLGATLQAAVEGRGPFERSSTGATLRAILIDGLAPPRCSPALAAAISGMLQRDPARRASMGQAHAALQAATQALALGPQPATHAVAASQAAPVQPALPPVTSQPPPSQPWLPASPAAGPPAPWELAKTTVAPSRPPAPPPQPAPEPQARPRRRTAIIAVSIAAAAVLAAGGVTAGILLTGHSQGSAQGFPNPSVTGGRIIADLFALNSQGENSAAFSPDGKTVATPGGSGSIALWNAATGRMIANLADPDKTDATAAAYSPDGQTLAVADDKGRIYLWNTATHHITATWTEPSSNLGGWVTFSPVGQTFATGGDNSSTDSIYLWDAASHATTASLSDPNGFGVTRAAFSPDGQTLAAADVNGHVYLWDIATQKITATLTDPHSKGVLSVAFSPDGQTLATADDNGHAYLWDIATQKITATLTVGYGGSVESVAFSPDGQILAADNEFTSVFLWRIPSGG